MNIAVLGDIHGNYAALCAVLDDIARCGDVFEYGFRKLLHTSEEQGC